MLLLLFSIFSSASYGRIVEVKIDINKEGFERDVIFFDDAEVELKKYRHLKLKKEHVEKYLSIRIVPILYGAGMSQDKIVSIWNEIFLLFDSNESRYIYCTGRFVKCPFLDPSEYSKIF